MNVIIKAMLLMACSILIIIFASNIYPELIYVGEYKYMDKIDKEITSEILTAVDLANEGNITLFKKIPLNCKVLFENNSFTIFYKNKTYIHEFNENIIFSKSETYEISKISCQKINNTYLIKIE